MRVVLISKLLHVNLLSSSDNDSGFDYAHLPDPTDPANIDKVSGRGVFLMTNLSDSIQFEQDGRRVLLGFNG